LRAPAPRAETAGTDQHLVARTRQHSRGDLLRRTALRLPDKLAVVDGQQRLTSS
jgi:fatty-acyl-CoA synthase